MTNRIRVINAYPWNWYRRGEEYTVRDVQEYQDVGVQVVRRGARTTCPDVVANGDFVFIDAAGCELV